MVPVCVEGSLLTRLLEQAPLVGVAMRGHLDRVRVEDPIRLWAGTGRTVTREALRAGLDGILAGAVLRTEAWVSCQEPGPAAIGYQQALADIVSIESLFSMAAHRVLACDERMMSIVRDSTARDSTRNLR